MTGHYLPIYNIFNIGTAADGIQTKIRAKCRVS